MNHDDIEEKIIKTKGKMYAITTLSIISVIIIFFVMSIYLIKLIGNKIFKHREYYYSLEINSKNKEQIVSLLKSKEIDYCESLYKIEYTYSFPHQDGITIYCKNDKNINLYTDNKDELIEYIKYFGIQGER